MHRVLIEPAGYDDFRSAVDLAFDTFPLDLQDKRVLVKPNVLRAALPEECITTHPAVLQAVVEKVETFGPAEIIVGDNPGLVSYGDNERSFARAGLTEAGQGTYKNLGEDARAVPFLPEYGGSVSVSQAVLDADIVISLPKFKTHGLTVMTGAIKNSYGILPGAQKSVLHRKAGTPERFHELIVEVFKLRVPDLFIMDAVLGMQGNGPASTDLRYIGRVIASDNAVALDAVVARMMGLDPAKLRFLQKAREEGLGDFQEEAIEVIGEFQALADFRLPPLSGEAVAGSDVIQGRLAEKAALRPQADPDMCTACGLCVDQCPAGALSMNDGPPQADPDKCVICFCCQEICPEKAMALK